MTSLDMLEGDPKTMISAMSGEARDWFGQYLHLERLLAESVPDDSGHIRGPQERSQRQGRGNQREQANAAMQEVVRLTGFDAKQVENLAQYRLQQLQQEAVEQQSDDSDN